MGNSGQTPAALPNHGHTHTPTGAATGVTETALAVCVPGFVVVGGHIKPAAATLVRDGHAVAQHLHNVRNGLVRRSGST